MNRKILYSLVLLLLFAACKYEDGPAISLNSKYQRLKGEWKIEYLEIDGVDSTQRYIDSCNCNLRFLKVHDYGQLMDLYKCKPNPLPVPPQYRGYWEFSNNKEKLHITFNAGGYKGIGPIGTVSGDWEILRLTKTEFWFTTTVQNKVYTFKFKR
jgi:hypothetical protein